MDALTRPAPESLEGTSREPGLEDWRAAYAVALVHDWLNQMGGAENVLEEFVALFPGAPILPVCTGRDKMPDSYRNWPIHTTFMQRLPRVMDFHQAYLPLYPARLPDNRPEWVRPDFEHTRADSATGSGHAKGNQKALHICYCLTPTRFLWLYEQ